MTTIKNIFKHLHLINKHRWIVFKLSVKAGIPFRGLLHDLSKYSLIEFCESVKYYSGNKSPITNAKIDKGYSKAWLHHKGRNKHHSEYWYDFKAPDSKPIIPYKYVAEMICDKLSAGIVYNGKKWTKFTQLEYFEAHKDEELINSKIENMLEEVFKQVSEKGIDPVINAKNLKMLYKKYTGIKV